MRQFFFALFYFLFVLSNDTYSQDIYGKWLFLKEVHTYYIPETYIYEINEKSMVVSDFNEIVFSWTIDDIKSSSILVNGISMPYQIKDQNILSMKTMGKFKDKDTVLELNYLRLSPTMTSISRENIRQLKFDIYWDNELQKIEFDKSLEDELFHLEKYNNCNRIKLENIESTYFVSFFFDDQRKYSFPIKVATEEYLILLVPTNNPYEIKVFKNML